MVDIRKSIHAARKGTQFQKVPHHKIVIVIHSNDAFIANSEALSRGKCKFLTHNGQMVTNRRRFDFTLRPSAPHVFGPIPHPYCRAEVDENGTIMQENMI
jgi:hypothetical protein